MKEGMEAAGTTRLPDHPIQTTLIDLRDHSDSALLAEFVRLYDETFTEPSEREDPSSWPERLSAAPMDGQPTTHLLVSTQGGDRAQMEGGLLFEYFPRSACGLLEYLVVAPESRGRGVGRSLVQHAQSLLSRDAAWHGATLRAVFAEVERPDFVPKHHGFSPAERWEFFSRLGALLIDIPYVQPALTTTSPRAYHLRLLAIPLAGQRSLDREIIVEFLTEYYRSLGVEAPERDPDWIAMASETPPAVRFSPLKQAEGHA